MGGRGTRQTPLDMAQPVAPLHSKRSPLRPKDSFSRLLTSIRLLFHPRALLEGVDASTSRTISVPDQLLPIDSGMLYEHLVDLVHHLQSLLPGSCEWLEQGALEFVGEHPVDAGGVADIWVGEMDNRRKVAIKAYRCYSSSNNFPTYVVSSTYLGA